MATKPGIIMYWRSFYCTLLFMVILGKSFSQDSVNYEGVIRPLMSKKCFECHNTGNPKGGVNLDNYKERARVVENGQFWLKVLDQIKTTSHASQK